MTVLLHTMEIQITGLEYAKGTNEKVLDIKIVTFFFIL